MNSNIKYSEEVAPGEYRDLFKFLMEDLKVFKRKMLLWVKSVETDEKQQYGLRYFEREHQAKVLELFEKNDFAGILELPTGTFGECATQMAVRYTDSGNIVGFQVDEARPHEEGRYVGLTPAKVFLREEGEKIVEIAKQVDMSHTI